MKKIFDLPVCGYDRAKSFYGKAKIIETENGGGKSWWNMQPVETEKPKAADMTPAESLKAMHSRRSANSMNY